MLRQGPEDSFANWMLVRARLPLRDMRTARPVAVHLALLSRLDSRGRGRIRQPTDRNSWEGKPQAAADDRLLSGSVAIESRLGGVVQTLPMSGHQSTPSNRPLSLRYDGYASRIILRPTWVSFEVSNVR